MSETVFRISIADSWVEWEFPLEISGDHSIDEIHEAVCKHFAVHQSEGKIRRRLKRMGDDEQEATKNPELPEKLNYKPETQDGAAEGVGELIGKNITTINALIDCVDRLMEPQPGDAICGGCEQFPCRNSDGEKPNTKACYLYRQIGGNPKPQESEKGCGTCGNVPTCKPWKGCCAENDWGQWRPKPQEPEYCCGPLKDAVADGTVWFARDGDMLSVGSMHVDEPNHLIAYCLFCGEKLK